jgi:hypothetical protein
MNKSNMKLRADEIMGRLSRSSHHSRSSFLFENNANQHDLEKLI